MSNGETDFAAFEAAASAPEMPNAAPVEAKVPVVEAKEPVSDEEAGKPLDLTEGDESVDAAEGDAEEPADDEGRKRRSKPAHMRIAQEVAKRHEAERALEALRAKYEAPAQTAPSNRPDPEAYEFGEVDAAYIEALTDWKLDTREAERAKANEANATRQQFVDKINTGVTGAETAGKAKYADFEDKVASAVEARGGDPLPPLVTVGISLSPVGGDIIYRLATDEKAVERLEALARGGETATTPLAMALGELEGEYMDDDDSDLDMTDQLDLARMLGRMKSRLKGVAKPAAVVTTTNAPEPPAQRARGGSGQFTVGADTNDFAAFEKMANAKR